MNCTPDKATFLKRAAAGNLVPVWWELLADLDTPVSAYERLRTALRDQAELPGMFLLESVEGGATLARYSFLGGSPRVLFVNRGSRVEIRRVGQEAEMLETGDALSVLKDLMDRYRPVQDPDLPPFFGGAVGYIG